MDERDRLLIVLLRRNARAPVVELARGIGLSRSATQDRLTRLEASGAIARYTIVEANPPDGLHSAHILLKFEQGKHCAQIAPRIERLPGVTLLDSLAGEFDLLVSVDADSVEMIERSRSAIAETPGVAHVVTFMVLKRHQPKAAPTS